MSTKRRAKAMAVEARQRAQRAKLAATRPDPAEVLKKLPRGYLPPPLAEMPCAPAGATPESFIRWASARNIEVFAHRTGDSWTDWMGRQTGEGLAAITRFINEAFWKENHHGF